MLRAPGRNADAVAEMAVGLLFAVTRGIVRADLDVREGETYRDGTIPYQRFRAWQVAGQTVGIVGYGAVGRAAAWRFAGLGMNVISYDPFAPDATHSLDDLLAEADVVSMHAAVTPESDGHDRRRAVRPRCARVRSTSTPPGRCCTTPTRSPRRCADGHLGGAGLDHFVGEHLAADHPLCSMSNVVLTPHIGGATYDTEANHTTLIVDGLVSLLDGGTPAQPGEPGGPQVSDARADRGGGEGAAPRGRPGDAHVGTRRRAPPATSRARLPDGNVVLTPSSLDYLEMDLDDLVVCDLDGDVVEGHRGPTTEKVLHLAAMRRYPGDQRDHALPRQALHDVRVDPPADPGGHRGVRRVRRRRRAGRRTTRPPAPTSSREEVAGWVGDRSAVLMANHGLFAVGKSPADVLHIADLVERTAEIVWGAQRLGEIVPLPAGDRTRSSPGYYRYGRTGKF